MGIIQGIISGIAGIGQGLIQRRTDQLNTQRNLTANKQLADYQYSKDLEMWNKGNEYNTPKAQMGRFDEAGLNKNLIYGQGNAGNATSLPKYQAPQAKYEYKPIVDLPSMISMYQTLALKQAQTDNLRAQKEVIEANQGYINAKTTAQGILNKYNPEILSTKSALLGQDLEMTVPKLNLLKYNADMSHLKRNQYERELDLSRQRVSSQIGRNTALNLVSKTLENLNLQKFKYGDWEYRTGIVNGLLKPVFDYMPFYKGKKLPVR